MMIRVGGGETIQEHTRLICILSHDLSPVFCFFCHAPVGGFPMVSDLQKCIAWREKRARLQLDHDERQRYPRLPVFNLRKVGKASCIQDANTTGIGISGLVQITKEYKGLRMLTMTGRQRCLQESSKVKFPEAVSTY